MTPESGHAPSWTRGRAYTHELGSRKDDMDLTRNTAHVARRAGLRAGDVGDLGTIERRRLQVWIVMAVLLVTVSIVNTLGALSPDVASVAGINPATLHLATVVLSLSFTAYVFEKEIALRRLTRLVFEEREQRIRLDAQARRIHGLVEEAQALRAPLDLDRFLETVMRSAIDLVGAAGAAISTVGPDGLQLRAVYGRGVQHAAAAGRTAEEVSRRNESMSVTADPGLGYELSGLAVPISHRSRVVGVLDVRSASPILPDTTSGASLVALAEHVAVALTHALRYVESADEDHGSDAWSELQALAGGQDVEPVVT